MSITAILQDFKTKKRKEYQIMKKLISIILVAVSVLTLFCSCGKKEEKIVVSGNYSYTILEDNTAKITKYNGAEELLTLEIPSSFDDVTVTVIGAEAFSGVQTIGAVTFPSTLVRIEENAFKGSSITRAYLHRSTILTEIGAYAFSECPKLVQVDLPSSLTTVGERAFHYNQKLKVVNFRSDVENIGEFILDSCPNVKIYIKSDFANLIAYAQNYGLTTSVSEK